MSHLETFHHMLEISPLQAHYPIAALKNKAHLHVK